MPKLKNDNNTELVTDFSNDENVERESERHNAKLKFFENLQEQLNKDKKEEQKCSD